MAGKPAATMGSPVSHVPPTLTGAGCFMVLINNKPAWRGLPAGGGGGGGGGAGGGGGIDTSSIESSSASLLQDKKAKTQELKALGEEDSDEYKEALAAEDAAQEMVSGIMGSLSSGLGGGVVSILQSAKKASDAVLETLKRTAQVAVGPAKPIAEAAEKVGQLMAVAMMAPMIMGMALSSMPMGMADIHTCTTPLPLPPHGPGLVIDGSATVLICGMPAAKQGCTIVEAVGPPNKITMGEWNVLIGG